MVPRRLGYDVDDDVARVVAFVLSLQRLHSARFNILTKIPGATEGGGPGIRAVSVRNGRGGEAVVVRRGGVRGKTFQACSHGNARSTCSREREREAHPGLKFLE